MDSTLPPSNETAGEWAREAAESVEGSSVRNYPRETGSTHMTKVATKARAAEVKRWTTDHVDRTWRWRRAFKSSIEFYTHSGPDHQSPPDTPRMSSRPSRAPFPPFALQLFCPIWWSMDWPACC